MQAKASFNSITQDLKASHLQWFQAYV